MVDSFDPVQHIYRSGGLVVPSVTQVLTRGGFIDDQWYTEAARWRGSWVHAACLLDDQDDLSEESFRQLSPEIEKEYRGFVQAWRKAKAELKLFQRIPGAELIAERPMFSKRDGYAGTADRVWIAAIEKRKRKRAGDSLIADIKTGEIHPATALQTAGYANLVDPDHPERFRRVAIRLKSNETYSVKEFPLGEIFGDIRVFKSALSNQRWKENH